MLQILLGIKNVILKIIINRTDNPIKSIIAKNYKNYYLLCTIKYTAKIIKCKKKFIRLFPYHTVNSNTILKNTITFHYNFILTVKNIPYHLNNELRNNVNKTSIFFVCSYRSW